MVPNQTPTFTANIPADLSGNGDTALKLAAAYFGDPLEWQELPLRVMLARNEKDLYRCPTFALSVPRQNGKSWIVRARCFYGALNGEKILYTCQHGDTADEMFAALSEPFEDEDEPELHELLKAVRKTNGQQAIKLKGGGLIRFTTRTDSLARGKTYDVLIYDEAQELTSRQQAASLPAISAGHKHNPQTIYLGTPPAPENIGGVFRDLHEQVHKGESKMAWIEWAASEIGDKTDEARWYQFNPSLGTLVDLTAVKGESDQMMADVFARERLGWFPVQQTAGTPALDAEKWFKCQTDHAMEGGKLAFGVKFSPSGDTVAVSWARAEKGSTSYVELYDVQGARGGTVWLSDMLLRNKHDIASVVIDGKSGVAALVQRLMDNGFPKRAIKEGSAAIMQAAATMLEDEVNANTLAHIESPALDESATKCIRRTIGKDGWGFGDGDNVTAAPIESAALALWGARTTKRDPARQQEASF